MMFNKAVPPVYLAFEDSRVWEICCYLWGDTELIQGKISEGTITCDGSALVYSDSVFAPCIAIPSHKLSNKNNISASAAAQNFSVVVSVDSSNAFDSLGDDDVAIRIVQHTGNPGSVTELATVTKAQWTAGQSNNQMTVSAASTSSCKYLQVGVCGSNGVIASWTINAVTGNRQPTGITQKQCAAVTSIGTYFSGNKLISKFDNDSLYFTGLTGTLASNAFSSVASGFYLRLPYYTTVNNNTGYARAILNGGRNTAVRIDSATSVGAIWESFNAYNNYMVVTTPTVPTASSVALFCTAIYVRDELVSAYQTATYWKDRTIKSLHSLPTDRPTCPWIADLIDKGLIPSN